MTEIATKSARFGLPKVSGKSHSLIADWTCGFTDDHGIGVVLVTQCSLDRLPNLQAQLAYWTGKASVAVYCKPTECALEATIAICSTIEKARTIVAGNEETLDVAVTLVEGCTEGESYPINHLRNVALLEAQQQYLRFAPSLDQSAVLLVDVDFRPSKNLHVMLHSKYSETSILKEGKVVVCPAFESTTDERPSSLGSLKELVDNGQAEGFHVSHFPPGHGPTQFDKFWKKSLNSSHNIDETEYFWNESYNVKKENKFEPYIVMASADVPLYDERFIGFGLNKISHLDSVAKVKGGEYLVLPGVFLVAPKHEKSDSWAKMHGKPNSDQCKQHRMARNALYKDFLLNLKKGRPPIVSDNTRAWHNALVPKSQGPLFSNLFSRVIELVFKILFFASFLNLFSMVFEILFNFVFFASREQNEMRNDTAHHNVETTTIRHFIAG